MAITDAVSDATVPGTSSGGFSGMPDCDSQPDMPTTTSSLAGRPA